MIMKSKLNFIEIAFYFGIWISICLFALLQLYSAQTDIIENTPNIPNTLDGLQPGFSFLRRDKDESDIDWNTWTYFSKKYYYYMPIQFFVSESLRRTNINFLKYWYIISSAIFLLIFVSVKHLFIIASLPIIFWTVMRFDGKRTSIWVTSSIILVAFNSLRHQSYFWEFLDHGNGEDLIILLYTIDWAVMRCISYCLDYVDKTEKLEKSQNIYCAKLSVSENIINMYSYVLYLPVLVFGPIILYEEFNKSFHVKNENLLLRLKRFILNMTLYAFYTLMLELALHYIYFSAMQSNIEVVQMLPSIALCGAGLWMGLKFQMKYVITYGTTTSFCQLDNIETPPTPRCIARIHLYSQMWRYFDVGLYLFLFTYIYIPVYNTLKYFVKMPRMCYKLLSSLATFIFILMWHGVARDMVVWCVINYIGMVLENFCKAVGKSDTYKSFKKKVFKTDAVEVRFIAFLCVPLLCLSAISNFYFFSDSDVGDLYFSLMWSPSLLNFVILLLSLYSCCHVSIFLKDVPSRTDVKKTGNVNFFNTFDIK